MKIRDAVRDVECTISGDDQIDIESVAIDSRKVKPGSLFACISGSSSDGHDFIDTAIANGAVALICERKIETSVPTIFVNKTRNVLGTICSRVYGEPNKKLKMVGVTGTNGKTTTTYLAQAILQSAEINTGVIGTLSGKRTTPEAPDYYETLVSFVTEGKQAVVMEVSSHALAQNRVQGTCFDVAIFTNLTQDHLDYHETFENYFEAKARLFTEEYAKVGVINRDDEYGRRLLDSISIDSQEFGISDVTDLEMTRLGSSFMWNGVRITVSMPAKHNVYNALGAATAAHALGIETQSIADGLAKVNFVPGRLETIDVGQPFSVFVDYAHTPDGLENVLSSCAAMIELEDRRLITVFGCAGDRDREKRPLMGEIASRLSDIAILTSDNPRSEDPLEIIRDVEKGIDVRTKLVVEPDRELAIQTAIDTASSGDIVVIAGKGHESGQEVGGQIHPFDDRDVARKKLEARKAAQGW